jgi:hypothetical protein
VVVMVLKRAEKQSVQTVRNKPNTRTHSVHRAAAITHLHVYGCTRRKVV